MASQTQRKYQRRSAAEWRALLDAQATSGLSVGTFCRKVSVCTASFYRWQGVLEGHGDAGPGTSETVADRVPARATPRRTPDFVDLGALEDLAAPVPRDDAASPRVELRRRPSFRPPYSGRLLPFNRSKTPTRQA